MVFSVINTIKKKWLRMEKRSAIENADLDGFYSSKNPAQTLIKLY